MKEYTVEIYVGDEKKSIDIDELRVKVLSFLQSIDREIVKGNKKRPRRKQESSDEGDATDASLQQERIERHFHDGNNPLTMQWTFDERLSTDINDYCALYRSKIQL